MSDYIRSTQICPFDQLSPAVAGALRGYAEQHDLGDLAAGARLCCETTARKPKKGLFGKEEVLVTGVALTPQWLVWATGPAGQAPAVTAARLRDITVQDYEKSPMHKLIADSGVNVNGLPSDGVTAGTAFIGFGPEPDAAKFRAALAEALAAA